MVRRQQGLKIDQVPRQLRPIRLQHPRPARHRPLLRSSEENHDQALRGILHRLEGRGLGNTPRQGPDQGLSLGWGQWPSCLTTPATSLSCPRPSEPSISPWRRSPAPGRWDASQLIGSLRGPLVLPSPLNRLRKPRQPRPRPAQGPAKTSTFTTRCGRSGPRLLSCCTAIPIQRLRSLRRSLTTLFQ